MMKIQGLCFAAATTAALLFNVACGSSDASSPPGDSGGSGGAGATSAGGTGATPSTGGTGGGSTAGGCASATQQFPSVCDEATRTCFGIQVPSDEQACNECLTTAPTVGQDPSAPLTQCSCENCAVYLAACFDSATWEGANGDAQRDQLCRAIVECGQNAGCQGADCYLGGACAAEIDAAADYSEDCSTQPDQLTCVLNALANPDSAVMRASEVGACVQGDSTASPPATGNCQL